MPKTKIICTLGPASSNATALLKMMRAGMDVVRLNFSHGKHEDHAEVIRWLREISKEMNTPITILQDLQGPKIRVGQLQGGKITLNPGEAVSLVPADIYTGQPGVIPIDYPGLSGEAKTGMTVLLADGLFELEVTGISGQDVLCTVKEGGILESRKGVNFPNLKLKLPSLTAKDIEDLSFGLEQDVDWISLSFVRSAEDVLYLKKRISEKGYHKPVIAKIEKPQAVDNLEEIVELADGIMVATPSAELDLDFIPPRGVRVLQ